MSAFSAINRKLIGGKEKFSQLTLVTKKKIRGEIAFAAFETTFAVAAPFIFSKLSLVFTPLFLYIASKRLHRAYQLLNSQADAAVEAEPPRRTKWPTPSLDHYNKPLLTDSIFVGIGAVAGAITLPTFMSHAGNDNLATIPIWAVMGMQTGIILGFVGSGITQTIIRRFSLSVPRL